MIHTACKQSLEHAICVTVSCQACNLLLVGTLSCGCQLSRLLFFHGVLEHARFNSVKKNVGRTGLTLWSAQPDLKLVFGVFGVVLSSRQICGLFLFVVQRRGRKTVSPVTRVKSEFQTLHAGCGIVVSFVVNETA